MKHTLILLALLLLTPNVQAFERLHYDVKFGFLKAGHVEMIFDDKDTGNYTFTALAWSTMPMLKLYERILIKGVKNFRPTSFTMQQIEKDYRATKTLTLNKDDTATYQKTGDKAKLYELQGSERDYLSALFQLRTEGTLQVGQTITQNVIGMGGAYTMKLHVLEKKRMYSPATKWQDVFVIQPEMIKLPPRSGVNKDWKIYITTDERRLPIRIEAKLKFGSFKVRLKKISDEKSPSKAPKDLQSGSIFTKS